MGTGDTKHPPTATAARGKARCESSGKGAGVSDLTDVRGLEPFRPLDHLELYTVSFGEGAEAIGDNGRMVNEDILTAVLRNEAEPLCIVEPFNRALRHCYNLLKREPEGPGENPQPLWPG